MMRISLIIIAYYFIATSKLSVL